jgi:6-phosphogluconate dehydrogenase
MSNLEIKNQKIVNQKIGIIGLGTMGENLIKNFASKNIAISIYNRTFDKVKIFIENTNTNFNITGYETLSQFVDSLGTESVIFLLIKAGSPVDDIIEELLPFLSTNSTVVDLGNSFFKDTNRRQKYLQGKNINFISCGISGGSEGAKNGACFMPSGNNEIVNKKIIPLLNLVSAKDYQGNPTVCNIGPSFSGHYVKMVHNGIEYGIMQGLTELYSILTYYNYSNLQILALFEALNQEKKSFLIETTLKALQYKNNNNQLILPFVDQSAGSKGTGSWTVQSALELGVSVPTIAQSVFYRYSTQGNFFLNIDKTKQNSENKDNKNQKLITDNLLSNLKYYFDLVEMASFLQGLDLLSKASKEYNWNLNLQEIVRIWQGGCIIRSNTLLQIQQILQSQSQELNTFDTDLNKYTELITDLNITGHLLFSVPCPAILASISYLQTLQTNNYGTNLLQLMRHLFGDHEIKLLHPTIH